MFPIFAIDTVYYLHAIFLLKGYIDISHNRSICHPSYSKFCFISFTSKLRNTFLPQLYNQYFFKKNTLLLKELFQELMTFNKP